MLIYHTQPSSVVVGDNKAYYLVLSRELKRFTHAAAAATTRDAYNASKRMDFFAYKQIFL